MIARDHIGGGIVRRRFTWGGHVLPVGACLPAGELRSMRNLRELVALGAIEVWPCADQEHGYASEPGDRQ